MRRQPVPHAGDQRGVRDIRPGLALDPAHPADPRLRLARGIGPVQVAQAAFRRRHRPARAATASRVGMGEGGFLQHQRAEHQAAARDHGAGAGVEGRPFLPPQPSRGSGLRARRGRSARPCGCAPRCLARRGPPPPAAADFASGSVAGSRAPWPEASRKAPSIVPRLAAMRSGKPAASSAPASPSACTPPCTPSRRRCSAEARRMRWIVARSASARSAPCSRSSRRWMSRRRLPPA